MSKLHVCVILPLYNSPRIQNFVAQEPSLRLGVSQVALGQEMFGAHSAICNTGGVVVSVMQNDARMWKAARTAWHRLLIATTLMDYSTKRAMAIIFTKNYGKYLYYSESLVE